MNLESFAEWYLTPTEEKERRTPQGMIGTAILSEYQEPVEELIFHDKLYGIDNTPRATLVDHPSGCEFCWWFLAFRAHPTFLQAFDGVYRESL